MYAYLEGELNCKEIIQQMTAPHTQIGQSHRFLQGFKGKKGYFAKLYMLPSHTSIGFHCYQRLLGHDQISEKTSKLHGKCSMFALHEKKNYPRIRDLLPRGLADQSTLQKCRINVT
jgi:hypothetical protein